MKKRPPNNDWYRNVPTFHWNFRLQFGFDLMSLPGFCLFQSWMADFLKTCQPCLQISANFLEPRKPHKPVIALSLPKSGFLARQCRKQGVQISSLTPTCHLLTPESILSSSYTSEMALDQVIVTLDSIKVRMCDATVAYVPSD